MNSKKKLLITAAAFIIVIILAVIAYRVLAKRSAADNLMPAGESSETSAQTDFPEGTSENSSGNTQGSETVESDSEASSSGESGSSSDDSDSSNPVPEFSMTNADGDSVSISDLTGKPVIINFWASTCPYCLDEMPHFQDMYDAYSEDINFVMLDIIGFNGETEADGRAYIEAQGYTFPVYYDTESEATYAFGLRSLPMTLFIDKDGNMIAYANGRIDADILQQGIDMLLEN
ncbi:MAG TPA: TlpA family protein disulfide reductase [Candidatus Scybalocola faecipullorum]|nr:TlpA family protein disulfide reductase [Candidatus Scybalocola faecipullorum]